MPESAKAANPISLIAWVFATAAFVVLGITLYVYSTSLNPGLPILLGAGFAAVVALWRLFKGSGPYYHWGMDVGGALLVWTAISTVTGLDAYLAQRRLATFVGAVAFLWACQCALRHSRDWRLFGHVFLAVCTAASLAAWPEGVSIAMQTGHIPPLTGTFNNPDTFSILPLFALMLAPGLLERTSTRVGVLICLQIGVLFITLVATGCRASLLGLGVGAFAFAGTLLYNRSTRHLKHVKVLLAVPIALVLLTLPLSNFGVKVFDKYTQTLSAQAVAREQTRIEVATTGWKAALLHPLTGAGPGCFGLAFQSVRGPGHDSLYLNIAHNDPIEVAVELGLLGFALWLGLLFACLHKPFRLVQSGRRPIAAASMISSVVAIIIYSFFNFVIAERPVLWAQYWIFGLALSFPSSRLTQRETPAVRYSLSLALLVLAGWAMLFGYRSVQADSLLYQSRSFARELQVERAIESLESAIALQPQRANLYLEFVELEKSWSAFYPGYDSEKRRLEALKAAKESSPVNLGVLLALSEFYEETGDLIQAAATLDRALQLTPHRATLRERRAALAIRQGDLETALVQLFLESPQPKHDAQIAALLIALETKSPGHTAATLKTSLPSSARERLPAILESAIETCWSGQQWRSGLQLADLATELSPDDLCLQLRQANFMGKIETPQAEWVSLDKAISTADPASGSCYAKLVERWYQLSLEQGQQTVAVARLQNILEGSPRVVTARALLAQALFENRKTSQAIAILREGLENNARAVPLLKQLAAIYEQSGHPDLAMNYYNEAAKADPKDPTLKAKLQRLRKGGK